MRGTRSITRWAFYSSLPTVSMWEVWELILRIVRGIDATGSFPALFRGSSICDVPIGLQYRKTRKKKTMGGRNANRSGEG